MAGRERASGGLEEGLLPRGLEPHGDTAPDAPFAPRRPGWPIRLKLRAEAALEREIDAGRGFLWLPVAAGIGILLYFALPAEPMLAALLLATSGMGLAAWRLRHGGMLLFRLALVAAMLAGGAATIKLHTDLAAAPRLDRQVTGTLTGFVEARDARRGGYRLTIRVVGFEGRGPAEFPERVNVTVRGEAPRVGEGVEVLARLRPASGPAQPGSYDFGLPAYYAGIGGTGFAYGAAKPAELGPPPISIRLWMPIEALREAIRARIAASLSGDTGKIATALIIGDAGGISEAGEDALRQSGLAHVLSVSGLHMALVAGAVFWAVRALLALHPGLALRRPIKKWAAATALGVTFFYLLISGLDVAAQRSFVMIGVVFVAVLLDRRAISMRNVAIATLIVLAISPQSLLAAGFQMSFAATVALVAGFEAMAKRPRRRLGPVDRGWLAASLRWIAVLVAGISLTSLLGGLGTTPFALYHFQRMAPLSILANVMSMPLVDFLVMPLALLAVLAMPFGLDPPLLWLMGVGVDGMSAVARWVSALSEGSGNAAMPSAAALLVFVAGFLWLALMGGRWRLLGLAPMLVGGLLALFPARPDLLVAPDGRQVAIRAADGSYRLLAAKPDAFITGIWLRADGDRHDAKDPALRTGSCDGAGCVAALPDGRLVALALSRDAFDEDCRRAALIVTPLKAPSACAAQIATIDREQIEAHGAIALYLRPAQSTPAASLAEADESPAPVRQAETEPVRNAEDEDAPPADIRPAGAPPRDGARAQNALAAAFRVEGAYPTIRRPWMPPYQPEEEAVQ